MLQYKHVKVATLEGYAGTSESGFVIEIKQAEDTASYEDVIQAYERTQQGEPPMGQHHKTLERELGGYQGKVVTEERFTALAKAKAKQLHRGELTDCFYDSEKALCRIGLARQIEERIKSGTPLLSQRSPLSCSCSFVHHGKLPAWERIQEDW